MDVDLLLFLYFLTNEGGFEDGLKGGLSMDVVETDSTFFGSDRSPRNAK